MKVIFYNVGPGEPSEFDLPQVPAKGDEITLNAGWTYRVESIRWQLTSKGVREAGLTLQKIEADEPHPVFLEDVIARLEDSLGEMRLDQIKDIAPLLTTEEHIGLGRHGLVGYTARTDSAAFVVTSHVTTGGEFDSLVIKRFI